MFVCYKHIRWKYDVIGKQDRRRQASPGPTTGSLYGQGKNMDKTSTPRSDTLRSKYPLIWLLVLFFTACSPAAITAQPCQRNYTITNASHTITVINYHYNHSMTFAEAEKHCQNPMSERENRTLPLMKNNRDFAEFSRGMENCSQSSTWLAIKRIQLSDSTDNYYWVDGEQHDIKKMMEKPSSHRSMECGRVRLSTRELSNMWCGKANHGAICQFDGSCPAFSSPYNCHFDRHRDVSFTFYCAVANWYAASAICQHQGGHLAVFRNNGELNSMANFTQMRLGLRNTDKDLCDDLWVGLRRTVWNATESISFSGRDFFPVWEVEEPNGYDTKRFDVNACAAVVSPEGVYGWRADGCQEKHEVTCQEVTVEEKEQKDCERNFPMTTGSVLERPTTDVCSVKECQQLSKIRLYT